MRGCVGIEEGVGDGMDGRGGGKEAARAGGAWGKSRDAVARAVVEHVMIRPR